MTTSMPPARCRPHVSLLALGLLIALDANAQSSDATAAAAPGSQADGTPTTAAKDLDRLMVVGQRATRVSNGATNLDLDIKDTPQSISVVGREQMRQFGADSLNDALRLATGIQVEQVSTNLTNFLSRGFEIKNTQIDGVGMPNGWGVVTNAMDAYGFDKVEVIRGANGLLTGVGNASGTINYVRKRPTNEAQGEAGVTVGSESRRRVQADYSMPFSADGTWAGRLVAARERSDSYLRGFESDRTYLYGVVDGQVGENGTLAFGYSYQKADTRGGMWTALNFIATDGSQLSWPRGASTAQDWTYWNSTTKAAFAEYTHQLSDRWQAKLSYNYREYDHIAQLFMAYSPAGLDAATGTGLYGWAYRSPYETKAHIGELSLHGRFDLLSREQEAMFGVSAARSEGVDWYNPTDTTGPAFGPLPGFPYAGNVIPEPQWGAKQVYTTLNQRLVRVFGATRIAFTDRFKTIVGFNWAQYQRDSTDNVGGRADNTDRNLAPYVGATFDFTDAITGYANYSYIYQPQDQVDYDRHYLDPSKGSNYEIGVKGEWLDRRLLTTLALFKAKQEGLATFVGTRFMTGYAYNYYDPVGVESQGVELEVSGRVGEYTHVQFGYTQLAMDGADGSDTYPWVPRKTANLLLSTRLSSLPAISFGAGARWQSATAKYEGYVTSRPVRQSGYTLLNAFAAWDIETNLTLRVNASNLTDKKYIQSLYAIGYYGPPRTYAVSLDWRF